MGCACQLVIKENDDDDDVSTECGISADRNSADPLPRSAEDAARS